MRGDIHPVDELLLTVAGDPAATSDDVLAGRRMLMRAIRAEEQRATAPARGRHRAGARPRRTVALAGALAVILAVIVGGTILDTEPVGALDELALVAESAEPPTPTEGGYLYSRTVETSLSLHPGTDLGLPTSETVAYLLPIVRERWQGSDGVRVSETVQRPQFFASEVAAAYYTSGQAAIDGVGRTTVDDFGESPGILDERAWPSDPDELLTAMESFASYRTGDEPLPASVVNVAAQLLREPEAPPELRAAVITAVGKLGVGTVQRRGGIVTYTTDYTDASGIRYQRRLDFDAAANLVRDSLAWVDGDPESGTPPGTRISDVQMAPVRTVADIGSR